VESKRYWILSKLEQNNGITNPDLKDSSAEHFTNYELRALDLARGKVSFWAEKLNYQYGDVRVKQLKSRWGSCSSKGDLTFNYKVLFLEGNLQDYVIVHELCHIKQPNHSQKFWNLVERSLPNYEKMRSAIKTIY
jgi:predicted metal-dependent hydrolase